MIDRGDRARVSRRTFLGGTTAAGAAIAVEWITAAESEGSTAGLIPVGVAKVDVTPDYPVRLPGYAGRKTESEGVLQRLWAKALAIGNDDGDGPAVMLTLDNCGVPENVTEEVAARLKAKAGIKRERLVICSSHTHTAPWLEGFLPLHYVEPIPPEHQERIRRYTRQATDWLEQAALRAISSRTPGRLAWAQGRVGFAMNRRVLDNDKWMRFGVNPDGPVDRQLGLLRLERTDGTLIGLIANYAVHGTALGGGNRQVSGDVPGFAAEYVERELGAPMLFINGALGNAAPLYSVGSNINDPRLRQYDTLLGDRIVSANAAISETTANVSFSIGKTVIETPRKSGLGWPDDLSEYASVSKDGLELVRIPVYTLVINGDTVIWAAPLELFSEIALSIRDASPFANTFYFGLTNGSLLYLTTRSAFSERGYEPNVSLFTDQAEADFTSGVMQHLQKLRGR